MENQIKIIHNIIKPNQKCIYCGSQNTIRNGKRLNNFDVVQRYGCKDCKRKFMLSNCRDKRMRYPLKVRQFAIQQVKERKSLRKVEKEIEQKFKIKVSHITIMRWCKK